jgi:hypothetical protein
MVDALRADERYPVMIRTLRMVLALPLFAILVANIVDGLIHWRGAAWFAMIGEATAAVVFSALVGLVYVMLLARSVNRAIPQDQRVGYLDGLRTTASDLVPHR